MTAAITILIICLAAMFIQDLKWRHIHVLLPLGAFAASMYIMLTHYSLASGIWLIAYNCIFFIVTLILLTLYMSVKNKTYLNPFKNYFGLGDFLFYIAVSPLFFLSNYVVFFILSMVFSVAMQFAFKKFMKQPTVPLAGFASLLLLTIICKDLFLHNPLTILK